MWATPLRRAVSAFCGGLGALALVPAAAGADTVVVTVMNDSNTDNGQCSVREAVFATNSNASVNTGDCVHSGSTEPDRIQLPAGTAAISGSASEDANNSGDLDIEAGEGLTIFGEGQSASKLDGDVDRVVDQRTGPLTMRKLTVQDGNAGAGHGGNVLDRADALLTLDRVTIRDGEADLGGGVRVVPGSELVMSKSLVTNNIADGSQGGAGIHAGTPVTITDSTVSDNHATGSFGPGGMRIEGGPSTIAGSSFTGNSTASGAGGALEVTSSAMNARDLTLTDTVVSDNHADGYRGGGISYNGQGTLKITRSLFTLNTARSGGGAIEASDDLDTLKLSKSIVTSNTLSSNSFEIIGGAGISADGKSTISLSEIGGNTATSPNDMAIGFGGGIRNGGQMRITRSTLFENGSPDGFGGGVYQSDPGATLTLSNTTFNQNTASSSGGAVYSTLQASLLVYSSTFAANAAGSDGDAIYADGTGTADVKGSVFDNGPDACEGGVLSSKGFNVDVGGSCATGGANDKPATDPKLGIYDNYGGPIAGADGIATELHVFPIKKSSPAKDLIPKKKCRDDKGRLKTDERGHKRPGGKKCDAGSFER